MVDGTRKGDYAKGVMGGNLRRTPATIADQKKDDRQTSEGSEKEQGMSETIRYDILLKTDYIPNLERLLNKKDLINILQQDLSYFRRWYVGLDYEDITDLEAVLRDKVRDKILYIQAALKDLKTEKRLAS